jgi:parvulin-like peptidyl-prolyl isomerase
MMQALAPPIDTKLLLIEARREIPKDNMAKIEEKVKEIYDTEQIPKLIDGKKIKSRAELIQIMKQAGTSIADQQRKFLESSLAAQYANKKFGDDKEISHERMLKYYQDHIQEYEIEPRARWEHVMVRYTNYPSKADAYAKIAGWGNEILNGVPLADIARKHSDDLSSEDGGQHDWTTEGSLASETIDKAIFSLPVGQLSQILEDERGFHIVRVLERQNRSRKPFGEMQAEIKKKIKAENEGAALKQYVEQLRKEVPIWTIFDDLPKEAKPQG